MRRAVAASLADFAVRERAVQVEDLRFERASLSARARHHVRLWRADASDTLWAAAATEDLYASHDLAAIPWRGPLAAKKQPRRGR